MSHAFPRFLTWTNLFIFIVCAGQLCLFLYNS
jgi:hypothetical protein